MKFIGGWRTARASRSSACRATPWSRGLGKYYDDLIIAATTSDLIRDGFLSDFVAFAPSEPDLANVSTIAGDFHEGELAEAMDVPTLTGDIVETWLKRAENRPTFVFCVNRRHAQHVTERFLEVGVAAEYMDGTTDRARTVRRPSLASGPATRRSSAMSACSPRASTSTSAASSTPSPTKRRILFVQTIGRGLRTAEGKNDLLILDHAGNHLRLGTVRDIGQNFLDDGEENAAQRKAREQSEPP